MAKMKMNVTLEAETISLLNQAKKLNYRKVSRSDLIDYAVKNTFMNKEDQLRKELGEANARVLDLVKKLDEVRKEKREEKLVEIKT